MPEIFDLQFSHFDPLSPFQCCNHMTVSTKRISTLKRGREGFGYRQKKMFFFQLWKDAARKCLFCSNVSTFLSVIVVSPNNNFNHLQLASSYIFILRLSVHMGQNSARIILCWFHISWFQNFYSFCCSHGLWQQFTAVTHWNEKESMSRRRKFKTLGRQLLPR